MNQPQEGAAPARGVTIALGKTRVSGWWGLAIAVAVLIGVVWLVAHSRPSKAMLASGALWIVFLVYWSAQAKNRGADKSPESDRSRARHAMLLDTAILLLFIPVPYLTARFLPLFRGRVAAGLAVQAAFLLLAVWARRHLGRNWSAEVRLAEGHALVTSGPYRVLRHPIYTSMLGMAVGTTIVSAQWHSVVGVALMIAAYARKIRMEEKILSAEFAQEYADYKKKSWALVPGVF